MTDTGQVPGEGLPENAGTVEQPGVPTPSAYTYLSESPAEDEDLLLPGAQGAWGNEVAPPPPVPVVEAVHEPGPHETAGRDSGNVDLTGVRLSAPAPAPPRRPLHLGPPTPDASASPVRSLADRGPAGLPPRQPGPSAGPEYLDVPRPGESAPQNAAPWGAAAAPAQAPAAPVQVPVEVPAAVQVQVQAPVEPQPHEVPAPVAVPVAVTVPAAMTVPAPVAVEAEPAETVGPQAVTTDGPDGPGEPAEAYEAIAEPVLPPMPGVEGAATSSAAEAPGPVDPGGFPEPEPEPAPATEPGGESGQVPVTVPAVAADESGTPPAAAPVTEPQHAPLPEPVLEAESAHSPEPAVEAQYAHSPEPVLEPQPVQVPEPVADVGQNQGQNQGQDQGQGQEALPVEDAGPMPVAPSAPVPPLDGTPDFAPVTDSDAAFSANAGAEMPQPHAAAPDAEPAQADPVQAPVNTADPNQAPQGAQIPDAPVAVPARDVAAGTPVPEVVQEPLPAVAPDEPTDRPDPVQAVAPIPVSPTPIAASAPVSDEAFPPARVAEPVPADATTQLPGALSMAPQADQPLGEFVPVEGQVPTTPHLAPTPPHPLSVPVEAFEEQPEPMAPAERPVAVDAPAQQEPYVMVPAPREADPAPAEGPDYEVVQHAEDLDTRAADQDEESTAPVAEARQSTGPAAPAYDDAEREAVLKVMRERRDIRNGFRGDPIPHEVLLRVLEAAHTAPSVGHSQPWDFVVIRSADTRSAMHELAMRQRDAYAKSLPKGRAKQFKELKIEAILDTPVNIVVTADPTRGGRHTLGRHTQPQMAPYSSALAVENLWLAARAEGLGVGWVSFFDEREMVRTLGLPEHLEVVAYLCVGYVDEFPDEPELTQAGWSKRRPLSWVVHEETYGRRALPGEDPHDLLGETVAQIRPLDAKALGEAWERQKRMTKPPGSLGMLEIISAQLAGLSRQCPPPIPEPAAVAIFAGDHGVHAQGVTPWPQEVTAQMVANFLGGGAVCNAFASQVGAEVCVVDVGVATELPATPGLLPRKVRAGTSDMTTGPAMTREEAKAAIEVGIETARDLVAAGNKALLTGEMGIANTTASAALISVFTDTDPAEVTGRGTGINDETLARKTEVVRRAIELHQPDPADPIGVLAAVGGFEHAAIVGLLLGGASLRTPVILDGVSAGAAALVARAIAPEVLAACIAGHRSAEPGHVAALNKLGLRPLVDLDLRLGEGTGALLALPMVQSTARAMHEVATFDSAGVTEK
ncbi:nicotinate-nucleotide--dimethylbenzimidazole phosphoribosyltransferase [Streptomyces sp. NPDC088387]|uniref:nicotinate-nucleotide--dimethylbenzimidazole phosphoribosyltransferase n=1 Tax=Streptomyces sp. NPDC088387 TaxID=3365859 RepID=UPI0038022C58